MRSEQLVKQTPEDAPLFRVTYSLFTFDPKRVFPPLSPLPPKNAKCEPTLAFTIPLSEIKLLLLNVQYREPTSD